jgi:hypothetical protein
MMRWVLIALLGLAVAALVSLGTSDLTSQPVGLSSEPLTAGDQLAPRRTVTVVRTHTVTDGRSGSTRSATAPPPPVTTNDDHGGRGRGGRGGGGDADDD